MFNVQIWTKFSGIPKLQKQDLVLAFKFQKLVIAMTQVCIISAWRGWCRVVPLGRLGDSLPHLLAHRWYTVHHHRHIIYPEKLGKGGCPTLLGSKIYFHSWHLPLPSAQAAHRGEGGEDGEPSHVTVWCPGVPLCQVASQCYVAVQCHVVAVQCHVAPQCQGAPQHSLFPIRTLEHWNRDRVPILGDRVPILGNRVPILGNRSP